MAIHAKSRLGTLLGHACSLAYNGSAYRRFAAALGDGERAQRTRLGHILAALSTTRMGGQAGLSRALSYEAFIAKVPEATYESLRPAIERQRAGAQGQLSPGPCSYQPTSGSTDARKWIPYNATFRAELDRAAGPWLFDLAKRYPETVRGRHYWSTSWLPDELREARRGTSDLDALSPAQKWVMRQIMAVPDGVALLKTSHDAMFATLCCLAGSPDLSVLSVWSPTFALSLVNLLGERREEVAAVLERGDWRVSEISATPPFAAPRAPRQAQLLRRWNGTPDPAFLGELWPALRLISAWDTHHAKPWAARLKSLLPQAHFQGKGLWATEGVVTIPFRDCYPLAVTSHFYEFRCLATGAILPAWKLVRQQEVQPLLTAGNGFLRYALRDRLIVADRLGTVPTFTFAGRLDSVDLVGEKMDAPLALAALERLGRDVEAIPVGFYGVAAAEPPRYVAVVEGDPADLPWKDKVAAVGEKILSEVHHYRLARQLGQLAPLRAVVVPDAIAFVDAYGKACGDVLGERKMEPISLWRLETTPEAFTARFTDEQPPTTRRHTPRELVHRVPEL